MKKSFSEADELDGFDELQPADQDRIRKAWNEGRVPDEDVPETARKPEKADDANDEEKPKKKRAPPKKDDEGDVAKPKKARTSKKVRRRCPCFTFSVDPPYHSQKSDEDGDAADDDEEKEKPKKAPASKPRSKANIPYI
jgi:hypothetical protein